MTPHVWFIEKLTELYDSKRATIRWRCKRCGGAALLWAELHPNDMESGIVAIGEDCDLALIENVLET